MSNFTHNVDYKRTGFSYSKYNNDIQLKGTFNDFVLPAWTVENFNQNEAWKGRYNLTYKETYDMLSEEQKEKLREEVFESWGQTIWGIIRQRFGLVLDTLGWNSLTNNVKQNLYLAISYQINNWRVNLPYEINNNINRVSGNLQTTINASAFETGFDALSEQTKTALTATGLDTYNYEDLLTKCYREDTLSIEVEDTKTRISALEKRTEFEKPDNLLTRTEAANLYEKIGGGYITQAEGDTRYLKEADFSGLSASGYFNDETKVSDSNIVKILKNTGGDRQARITTSSRSVNFEILNNDNVERSLTLDSNGVKVDGSEIATTNSILSNIRTRYYDKQEVDTKIDTLNSNVVSEDNKLKDEIRAEIANTYYNKQDSDNNYYMKAEVDTKITSAVTGGQVDLSNYYNKQELDTKLTVELDKFYTQAEVLNNFVNTKTSGTQDIIGNIAPNQVIIKGEPVVDSNNAARMEDVIKENKRLLTNTLVEFEKNKIIEITDPATDLYKLTGVEKSIHFTRNDKQYNFEIDAMINLKAYIIDTFTTRESTGTLYLEKAGNDITLRERTISVVGSRDTFIPFLSNNITGVYIKKDTFKQFIEELKKQT